MPVHLSSRQKLRNVQFVGDDLFPERTYEKAFLFVLANLDLSGCFRCKQVFELLVVDFDIRGTEEELLVRVRSDVCENVRDGLWNYPRIASCPRLCRKKPYELSNVTNMAMTY